HDTFSRVEGGRLYQTDRGGDAIIVGTAAWFDWLEHHTTFLFAGPGDGCIVHKRGPDRTTLTWHASRTSDGHLTRLDLAPSRALLGPVPEAPDALYLDRSGGPRARCAGRGRPGCLCRFAPSKTRNRSLSRLSLVPDPH